MAAPYPGGSTLPGLRASPRAGRGLQYKPLSPWQQAGAGGLQGLGAYLMALGAGQPQQAPAAFQAALAGADDAQYRRSEQAERQEDRDYRRQEREATAAERERLKAEKEAAKVKFGEFSALFSDADPNNDPSSLQDLLPYLDPESGYGVAADMLKPQDPAAAPKVQEFYEGGKVIQKQWDAKTESWIPVGEGDRWKPEGEGIQIDTNGDGIPDVTIGGKGMKPLPESASQQTLRATMIEQATKDISEIDFDKVNPAKAATGQWLGEKNPIGEAFAQGVILNDDEKKLLGAQGKIQEAIISAITGAAYTEEQKNNMRSAYVPLPTDGPARRMEKLKGAAQFLRQLDKNSGYNRLRSDENNDGLLDELPPGFK